MTTAKRDIISEYLKVSVVCIHPGTLQDSTTVVAMEVFTLMRVSGSEQSEINIVGQREKAHSF